MHWSCYVAGGCMWWQRLHSSSLYKTVAHHGVGIPCRVIQLGESKMPFVPLGTLLVHDKTLLDVLSEIDTEFMEIRGITDVASSHRNAFRPTFVSFLSLVDLHRFHLSHTLSSTKTVEPRMPLRA